MDLGKKNLQKFLIVPNKEPPYILRGLTSVSHEILEYQGVDSLDPRVACKANVNQLNGTMQNISEKNSDNQDNISQLNETIQIIQSDIDDYSASCDAKIKEITDTLEYVKKIPMVIIVPSSEEIDFHRGEVNKIIGGHTSE